MVATGAKSGRPGLAPERLDQPTNNPVITLKPEGTTDPEVAIRVGGQQPLQGWEECGSGDGGACACSTE